MKRQFEKGEIVKAVGGLTQDPGSGPYDGLYFGHETTCSIDRVDRLTTGHIRLQITVLHSDSMFNSFLVGKRGWISSRQVIARRKAA